MTTFPVSGVQTWFWLPPVVGFSISIITSMVGVSGAFLILPFQISFLGFASPSASATNLVYNLIATPSGVYRYFKDGGMAWPLVWVIILGTLPGMAVGYFIRTRYLLDPHAFRLFVGAVLLLLAIKMLLDFIPRSDGNPSLSQIQSEIRVHDKPVSNRMSFMRFELVQSGEKLSFNAAGLAVLALIVGVVGGIYGIGGGAIIAPFCVAVFGMPIHLVAGAALAGTLATSILGVFFYTMLPAPPTVSTRPDWMLGLLFGVGGFVGMYCGAALQKFISQNILKAVLAILLILLAMKYLAGFA